MDVFEIGSRVEFSSSGIEGCVTGLMIRARGCIRYEVVWWEGRNRNEDWMEEFEVRLKGTADRMQIGFVSPATSGEGE